ncbi:MAG: hypothetical protein V4438_00830 [Patescibacteria group bacterium]
MIIIAEVKPEAPNWKSDKSWEELFVIAESIGDWISIHTDSRWGGSIDLIRRARKLTCKPILAKGIHTDQETIDKMLECGADYVLTLDFIPERNADKCLIEISDIEVLKRSPKKLKYVWNSRDIWALLNKAEPKERIPFEQVRQMFPDLWLCQASNISAVQDVDPRADAVLVGTHLEAFAKSL